MSIRAVATVADPGTLVLTISITQSVTDWQDLVRGTIDTPAGQALHEVVSKAVTQFTAATGATVEVSAKDRAESP